MAKRLKSDTALPAMGENGAEWISHIKKEEKLTKAEVEQIACRAFGFTHFPGWHDEGIGHLRLKGNKPGCSDRIVMSFYPSTGKILFQGKPEEKARDSAKWKRAVESYTSNSAGGND